MSAYLLMVTIGPVQEFIKAARRTRDLWFGSMLLSEISKAVAAKVKAHHGRLIFPPPSAPLVKGDEHENVANVILAEIETIDSELAERLKTAATERWLEFANPVWARLKNSNVLRRDVWDHHIKDVLEFYVAWMPIGDNHKNARRQLARLLAGRKNCREFAAGSDLDRGLPKSSLDGLRETVFLETERGEWPQWLRVRGGEHLDVIGLVKRIGRKSDAEEDKHRGYPSVSRVAADPWLRGVAAAEGGIDALKRLNAACRQLRDADMIHVIDTQDLDSKYKEFPYEGTIVYRSRHAEIIDEGGSEADRQRRQQFLEGVKTSLTAVESVAAHAGLGKEPDPYVAFLIADGDRVGKAISDIEHPDKLREFSDELSKFAYEAKRIVKNHFGVTIYAGGDDVVAFLPVDQALVCARELHKQFEQVMKGFTGVVERLPTLSVGIAIGHFLEDLEELRKYAKAAEVNAKGTERNGLAIHLNKRGGVPVEVRDFWTNNFDSRLQTYAEWFLQDLVSNRTPYELHRLADIYDNWPKNLMTAVQQDALRVIARKRPGGVSTPEMASIAQEVKQRVTNAESLRCLARELLIGRQLAVALKQRGKS